MKNEDLHYTEEAGTFLDSTDYEMKELPSDVVPIESTFCVRLADNVMEPEYPNHSIVFCIHSPSIDVGEVGVFMVNGKAILRKLGEDSTLLPINEKYEEIKLTDEDKVRVVGKVVGEPYIE